MLSYDDLANYIQNAAQARGIDPSVALTVARHEGLQPGTWQSNYTKDVDGQQFREPSYGPFQLLLGGGNTQFPTGLGNKFEAATGLDPSDPANVTKGIDFALDYAKNNGWGSWYGAKAAGISPFQGIKGQPDSSSGVSDGSTATVPSSQMGMASSAVPGGGILDMSPEEGQAVGSLLGNGGKGAETLGERLRRGARAFDVMPAARPEGLYRFRQPYGETSLQQYVQQYLQGHLIQPPTDKTKPA